MVVAPREAYSVNTALVLQYKEDEGFLLPTRIWPLHPLPIWAAWTYPGNGQPRRGERSTRIGMHVPGERYIYSRVDPCGQPALAWTCPGDGQPWRGERSTRIGVDVPGGMVILGAGQLERNISMERIHTNEVVEHIGERVRIAGWLHSLRR